jgi:hypothetical protein
MERFVTFCDIKSGPVIDAYGSWMWILVVKNRRSRPEYEPHAMDATNPLIQPPFGRAIGSIAFFRRRTCGLVLLILVNHFVPVWDTTAKETRIRQLDIDLPDHFMMSTGGGDNQTAAIGSPASHRVCIGQPLHDFMGQSLF